MQGARGDERTRSARSEAFRNVRAGSSDANASCFYIVRPLHCHTIVKTVGLESSGHTQTFSIYLLISCLHLVQPYIASPVSHFEWCENGWLWRVVGTPKHLPPYIASPVSHFEWCENGGLWRVVGTPKNFSIYVHILCPPPINGNSKRPTKQSGIFRKNGKSERCGRPGQPCHQSAKNFG